MKEQVYSILTGYDFDNPLLVKYPQLCFVYKKVPRSTIMQFVYAATQVMFGKYDAVFFEGSRLALFFSIFKFLFCKRRLKIVCRPRLLYPPRNIFLYIIEWCKIKILDSGVSHYLVISTDEIKNYNLFWHISDKKMSFLPFKVNAQDMLELLENEEGNYIYSGGDSLRDYETLFNAVRGLNIKVKILTNLKFDAVVIPENVEILHNNGTIEEFYGPLAKAMFAVFPIKKGFIRSAGQGTYLGAMFLNKAVIVSDTPGVRDLIIDSKTGIIVKPEDATCLREKISLLMEDSVFRRQIGENAKNYVKESFTHDKYVDNMFLILLKCLDVK